LNAPPIAYEQMMEQLTKENATSSKGGTPLLAAPLQPLGTSTQQTAAPAAAGTSAPAKP
jgi:hypothetical protein